MMTNKVRMTMILGIVLVYFPFFFLNRGQINDAVSNSWVVMFFGLVLFWRILEKKTSLVLDRNKKIVTTIFAVLFFLCLPGYDIITSGVITESVIILKLWAGMVYLPILWASIWLVSGWLVSFLTAEKIVALTESGFCLFDHVFFRFLSVKKTAFLTIFVFSCVFLCAAYPGVWIKDDVYVVWHYITDHALSNWHTFGYVLFVMLGKSFGAGIFGVNVLQTCIWLLIQYYVLGILENYSRRAVGIYTLFLCIGLTPFLYLSDMVKDTVFAMGMFAFSAGLFQILRTKEIRIRDYLILGPSVLFVTLCRHGGLIPVMVTFLVTGIFFWKRERKQFKRFILIPVFHIIMYLLVYVILFQAMHVEENPSYIMYSTPMAMIGAAAQEGIAFEPEDQKEIEKVMPVSEWADCYNKYWSDKIARPYGKIGNDRINMVGEMIEKEHYGKTLLRINAHLFLKHPIVYLRAFLAMSNEIWAFSTPSDFMDNAWNMALCKVEEDEEITYHAFYPVINILMNTWDDLPFMHALFWRGGVSFWIVLLTGAVFWIKRKRRYLVAVLPVLLYSVLLSLVIPASDPRYILYIIEAAIFYIAVLAGMKEKKAEV